MSHALGALAENLTHVQRYQLGNQAVTKGLYLAQDGRYEQAASLFAIGADVARVLAEASAEREPERVAHWRRVWAARRRLCMQAREAAGLAATVPQPRVAASEAVGAGATGAR